MTEIVRVKYKHGDGYFIQHLTSQHVYSICLRKEDPRPISNFSRGYVGSSIVEYLIFPLDLWKPNFLYVIEKRKWVIVGGVLGSV